MELLTNTIAWILTAVVGPIAATIFAHDILVSCDRVATKIIHRSADRLDKAQRDDAIQEWLADLSERETIIEKYRHAIGCYFAAGKMRRQFRAISLAFSINVTGVGPVPLNLELGPSIGRSALHFALGKMAPRPVKYVGAVSFLVYITTKFAYSANKTHPGKAAIINSQFKNFRSWRIAAQLKVRSQSLDVSSILNEIVQDPSRADVLLGEMTNIIAEQRGDPT